MATSNSVTPFATPLTQSIFFKRWEADSKGHKDLLALAAKGAIADLAAEVETIVEDGKTYYKRKTIAFTLQTLNVAAVTADDTLSNAQLDHLQELVNAALKKAVQTLVSDKERTTPVTEADLPTWEEVLNQPFTKREAAIKITAEMLKAATESVAAFLKLVGIGEKGANTTIALCTKKCSVAELNKLPTPIVEKVQELINTWFEELEPSEQETHLAVASLWTDSIEAKLNPKKDDISIDDFA